jgi:hypothetical protein
MRIADQRSGSLSQRVLQEQGEAGRATLDELNQAIGKQYRVAVDLDPIKGAHEDQGLSSPSDDYEEFMPVVYDEEGEKIGRLKQGEVYTVLSLKSRSETGSYLVQIQHKRFGNNGFVYQETIFEESEEMESPE